MLSACCNGRKAVLCCLHYRMSLSGSNILHGNGHSGSNKVQDYPHVLVLRSYRNNCCMPFKECTGPCSMPAWHSRKTDNTQKMKEPPYADNLLRKVQGVCARRKRFLYAHNGFCQASVSWTGCFAFLMDPSFAYLEIWTHDAGVRNAEGQIAMLCAVRDYFSYFEKGKKLQIDKPYQTVYYETGEIKHLVTE